MEVTCQDYDKDIEEQGLECQRSHYYEPPPGSFWDMRILRCLDKIGPSPADLILDVGCGVGTLAFHAARRGAKCIGVDYSMKSIEAAYHLSAQYTKQGWVQFLVASAEELPFSDNTFSKIIAADFVEHILDNDKTTLFREILRVLNRNGRFIVFTDNLNYERLVTTLRNIRNRILKKKVVTLTDKNPLHVGLITAAACARRLEEAGLTVERTEFFPNELSRLYQHMPRTARLLSKTPVLRRLVAQNFLLCAYKR